MSFKADHIESKQMQKDQQEIPKIDGNNRRRCGLEHVMSLTQSDLVQQEM